MEWNVKNTRMGRFKCTGWVYFTSVSWLSEARKVTLVCGDRRSAERLLCSPARGRALPAFPGRERLRVVPGGAALPRARPRPAAGEKQQRVRAGVRDVLSLRAKPKQRCGELELKVALKVRAVLCETALGIPVEFP